MKLPLPLGLRSCPHYHLLGMALFFLLLFLLYFSSILFSNEFIANDGAILGDFAVSEWTTYIFSGYPLLSDPTFYAFYPVKILIYKILRLDFNFFVISGYFLMAFFTYWYVYEITRVKISAFIAALMYSFSGYAIYEIGHATHFIHTICWLPFIVLCFEKLKRQFSFFWSMASVLAIPSSIAAGFPQLSLAMLPIILGYALILSFQVEKKLKQFGFYLLLIGGGYCIAAPIIVSTYILSLFSARAHISWEFFGTFYVELKQLLLFFFPHLMGGYYGIFAAPVFGNWEVVGNHGFLGFLGVLLAFVGLWKCSPLLKSRAYFWGFFAFLSVIVSLGPELSIFYKLLYKIPIVNNFRAPERYLFIYAFGMSVLAGLGIGAIKNGAFTRPFQKRLALVLAGLFACFLISMALLAYPTLTQESLNKGFAYPLWYKHLGLIVPAFWMLLSLVVLWWFLRSPQSPLSNGMVILTISIELLVSAYSSYWHPGYSGATKDLFYNPPAYLDFLRGHLNATHQRYLKMQISQDTIGRYLWGNFPIYYHLPSAGGYAPLVSQRYADFLGIANWGEYYLRDLEHNQAINIAGIKYLFTVPDAPLNALWFANSGRFPLRNVIGNTFVYENTQVLPRAWFTHKWVVLSDKEMLDTIHSGKFANGTPFEPASTALLKGPLNAQLSVDPSAKASIEKLSNRSLIIQTQTQKPQFLVVSDFYYPGWKVYIDGKKDTFYLTDYAYRGVLVPAGKHRVAFYYRPLYLYLTYVFAGIGFLSLVALFFYLRKANKF